MMTNKREALALGHSRCKLKHLRPPLLLQALELLNSRDHVVTHTTERTSKCVLTVYELADVESHGLVLCCVREITDSLTVHSHSGLRRLLLCLPTQPSPSHVRVSVFVRDRHE
jgi:hypothetical protein